VPRPRVLLAEDNALVATQIKALLETAYDVVGVVGSGDELVLEFERLSPEAIVTDIVMPGGGGLAAVRKVRAAHPGAAVVLLTVLDEPVMIRHGLSTGVLGYVVKEDAGDELLPAVEAALEGREFISAAGRRSLSYS
jgi:DNA-binding NarL/FixJ family response regulator